MILLCGATGLLGGQLAQRLAARGAPLRLLVRPATDATPVEALGEIVRGDLRDPASLDRAVAGAEVVVTTVTAMSRLLAGGEKTTIDATDNSGTANLIAAAVRAGARRFVYLSSAGIGHEHRDPLGRAKWANEERLRSSPLQPVILKPDAFQEIWLSPAVGVEVSRGKMIVYGRGDNPVAYVAVPDVAEATARLTLADDPPERLEFGGPEPLTRNEVVRAIERATGRPLKVRRVPRLTLRAGSRALRPVKQELASVMALALYADTQRRTWDAEPLLRLGIEPRPASGWIRELAAR
jgi:NADH dehydrogenase